MNAGKYDFAIVGCGMIARFHARAIRDLPNAALVAVYNVREAGARRAGEELGVDWTTSLDDLLRRDDVDLVTICTPSGAHLEPALAAARYGKHAIVEKPIEITLDRCDQMVRAYDAAGLSLGGVFQSRFHRVSRVIKDAIDSERFGILTLADATVKWWRSQEYYDDGGWKGTKALDGGGALMNQSIHAIDLLRWWMGPIGEIAAFTATLGHERIDVEDTAVAALRFENGALGTIEGTTAAFPGFFKKLEISGTRGSVVLEEEDLTYWHFDDETDEDDRIRAEYVRLTETGGGASDPAAISHEGHRHEFASFLEALDEGRRPFPDGRDARHAVEVILAIYEAARSKRVVSLPL